MGPFGGNSSGQGRPQQPVRRPNYGKPMMQRPPMGPVSGQRPFGMGPMPTPNRGGGLPTSNTGGMTPISMPMGNQGIGTPGQQPLEENQLWRTYNRLLGGQMAPRMLF